MTNWKGRVYKLNHWQSYDNNSLTFMVYWNNAVYWMKFCDTLLFRRYWATISHFTFKSTLQLTISFCYYYFPIRYRHLKYYISAKIWLKKNCQHHAGHHATHGINTFSMHTIVHVHVLTLMELTSFNEAIKKDFWQSKRRLIL